MFVYWILFPLLFGATLAGLGLGVRKLSVPFSPALVMPLGFSVALIWCTALCWSSATVAVAGPGLVVLALIGWAFNAKDVRAAISGGWLRRNWPLMGAFIAAFLVFGASVITTGHPTFTGYNQIVDIAHQMDWSAYLGLHGRTPIGDGVSASLNVVNRTLSDGYPAGPQSILGTFPKTFGMALSWCWQPYLAMIAACIVASAYALMQQVTNSRVYAGLAAFSAGQASALIGYGQIGGIKELSAAAVLLAAASGVTLSASPAETKAWRAVLPFGVTIAAVFSTFSLTALPWLGVLGVGAALLVWRTVSLKAAFVRGGILIAGAVILAIPTISPALHSLTFGNAMTDNSQVGNLAHALSHWAISGAWYTDDHRLVFRGTARTVSVIASIVVIVLAVLGLVVAWRRKAHSLIVLWLAVMAGFVFLTVKMGPWVELKGIVVASPMMLLMAAVGASTLLKVQRKQLVWVAWGAVGALVLSGLWGDGLRYWSAQTGPWARLQEEAKYDKEFLGLRGALIVDWDEEAEYQLRGVRGVSPFNYTFVPSAAWSKDPSRPAVQYSWDLDDLAPSFATFFDTIVVRNSPGQSRPSQNYELVAHGRFFDVWRRTSAPAATSHIPLGLQAVDNETCQSALAKLPKSQSVTISSMATTTDVVFPNKGALTGKLTLAGPGTFYTPTAGTATGTVNVPTTGSYDVFLTSISHRKTVVYVDGKAMPYVTDPQYAIRGQMVGSIPLTAGTHKVVVKVNGRTLASGSGNHFNKGAFMGPVTFAPSGQLWPALIKGTAGSVTCPVQPDWIETP